MKITQTDHKHVEMNRVFQKYLNSQKSEKYLALLFCKLYGTAVQNVSKILGTTSKFYASGNVP